jgi:hypothetical protein
MLHKTFAQYGFLFHVGFEILTAVTMKRSIFWDITFWRNLLQPEDGGDMFL